MTRLASHIRRPLRLVACPGGNDRATGAAADDGVSDNNARCRLGSDIITFELWRAKLIRRPFTVGRPPKGGTDWLDPAQVVAFIQDGGAAELPHARIQDKDGRCYPGLVFQRPSDGKLVLVVEVSKAKFETALVV